ncbi:MAG TPA: glutamate-cysteine ligase family protein [Kofleriaceae bacterium]|nr:glutamate-cysteine ligase family protein [Kofleriaceae bacterium]
MHLVDEHDVHPIGSVDELITYFVDAGKPASAWRVGSEHELVGVYADTGEPPTYDGPRGIGALFQWFANQGGTPVLEDGHMIALSIGESQLTIEPGGQFELASRPVDDDRKLVADLQRYIRYLASASKELGLAWLSTGLRPFGTRDDIPWMPKQRYDVMRAYMPTVGTRGLDMMLRTATVQANLDFADEADAAAKLRCLYSMTSILTALWASSPIVDEQISGFQSYRAWIWRDTDNARAGLLRFVFERDDIFRAYTEWALDVPLYFVYRGGYRPVPADLTFRRYLAEGWQGTRATMADWALHLSTLFPEGRLKKFIEVRGCDCGSFAMISALAPMMRGILYDDTARAAATALTAGLSFEDRQQLADDVPRSGLATKVGDRTLLDLARELVAIARDGLSRVAPVSLPLLAPVDEIAATGRTQSDRIIDLWRQHAGDRAQLIRALAHPGLGAD